MRKSFKTYLIIWALLLIGFNILVFVTPNTIVGTNISKFEGTFVVGYVSVLIGFIGQLICSLFAFKETNNQKFFYKMPLITITYSSLVVLMIIGLCLIYVYNLPNWIAIIVVSLTLIANIISIVKTNLSAEIIGGIDDSISNKYDFYRDLTDKVYQYYLRNKNNKELEKVYELLRYSNIKNINMEELDIAVQKLLAGTNNYDEIKGIINNV